MISQDLASKMQDIIRKHGEAYRNDLPGLIDQMHAHVDALVKGGSIDILPVLQREAHDMKGQAATFGMIGISTVADSLSRILDRTPELGKTLTTVLHAHVAALQTLLEKDDPQLVAYTIGTATELTPKDKRP